MAKLTGAINTFLTGDMVFTRYPPKGHQPIHVTLYLQPRDAVEPSYVHAGATQLEVADASTYADDKDSGGYLHATPVDATHREAVAAVARIFAAEAARTPYGSYPSREDFVRLGLPYESPHANRFTGMIRTARLEDIPFDFPALHRLLKWTYRAITRAPLSENRGITCAAFVAASHQVACMSAFLMDLGVGYTPDKIKDCVTALNGMVQTKSSLREGLELLGRDPLTEKNIYKNQAHREHSNRQLTDAGREKLGAHSKGIQKNQLPEEIQARIKPEAVARLRAIDRAWLVIQTKLLGIHESQVKLIDEILGPDFLFDAKYVSSPILAQLVRDSPNWTTTVYEKY